MKAEVFNLNEFKDAAIRCAEQGLFHKVCSLLTSSFGTRFWSHVGKIKGKAAFCASSNTPKCLWTSRKACQLDKDFDILKCLHRFPKATACGPSMLRVQHMIDMMKNTSLNSKTQLPSHLQQLIILLASGKVLTPLTSYLVGGNPVAIMKVKKGGDWDVRSIAVGEVVRCLTGKCL